MRLARAGREGGAERERREGAGREGHTPLRNEVVETTREYALQSPTARRRVRSRVTVARRPRGRRRTAAGRGARVRGRARGELDRAARRAPRLVRRVPRAPRRRALRAAGAIR